MTNTITILNGFEADDPAEHRLVQAACRVACVRGDSLREVVVRNLRLGDCTGCFDCFVRTPGSCRMRDDGAAILEQILASDLVIFAGRIRFGGFSSGLKRIVDHVLPLLLPFFRKSHGDTHHPARYKNMPRVVGVGMYTEGAPGSRQSDLFRTLVGRNAVNMSAPSFAAEAIRDDASESDCDERLRATLDRIDPWPSTTLQTHWPAAHASAPWDPSTSRGSHLPRRVLAIVGSSKIGPSNSAVLSDYFSARLRSLGWEVEPYVLKGDIRTRQGRARLLAAVERADMVTLAAPLFVDSLHYRVTLALEVLAAERSRWAQSAPKRLVAMINSGFPEAHQNTLALAICEQFAAEAGWIWAGGLAVGGGEMLNAKPLDAAVAGRPPTHHLRAALDVSAEALHRGASIPDSAQALIDRSPLPGVPPWLWRMVFRPLAGQHWRGLARRRGLRPRELEAQPLGS